MQSSIRGCVCVGTIHLYPILSRQSPLTPGWSHNDGKWWTSRNAEGITSKWMPYVALWSPDSPPLTLNISSEDYLHLTQYLAQVIIHQQGATAFTGRESDSEPKLNWLDDEGKKSQNKLMKEPLFLQTGSAVFMQQRERERESERGTSKSHSRIQQSLKTELTTMTERGECWLATATELYEAQYREHFLNNPVASERKTGKTSLPRMQMNCMSGGCHGR